MSPVPDPILIYHITDVANLGRIVAEGGLKSDSAMAGQNPTVIGYGHIKQRRMTAIRIPCCRNRFVGEFVPFYFCPRSPMLYTINLGNTGRPAGCQRTIVHLVSTVGHGMALGRDWAISDGNAGAFHTSFFTGPQAVNALNWTAIQATDWREHRHQKSAEFLVADFFPWSAITRIGCHPSLGRKAVEERLAGVAHRPVVEVQASWYY